LVALSAVLHLYGLGERSFHHDEAVHAQLSWELLTLQHYRYDPTFHGPVLYFLTAGVFGVAGDSDFTARLSIALAGMGLLWVAWRLRRPFGERAAWWSGLLLTISPTYLFFGRFLRMDLLEVFFASLAVLAAYRASRGKRSDWVWFGLWLGLAFATKENAYVTAALFGLVFLVTAIVRGLGFSLRSGAGFVRNHGVDLAASCAIFVLVTIPLYTAFFAFPEDWLFPIEAVSYWWEQHNLERVGGPWWFHLPRLLQYEFLILGAACVWIIRRGRRARDIERFIFLFGLFSIGMYVYLGEKVPWLGVHQLWPFIPLAGAQLARTMGPAGRWWSRVLAGTALVATVAASLTANFLLDEISPGAERVESLHFVQTCPEFVRFSKTVVDESEVASGVHAAVSGQAVWPLRWYWRHLDVRWGRPDQSQLPPVVVCDPEDADSTRRILGSSYGRMEMPMRAWWLMYVGKPRVLEVLRYFVTRRPWGYIGSTDVVVFQRLEMSPDLPEAAGAL
jgi:uncharacterized protein (TIGR03663 family)